MYFRLALTQIKHSVVVFPSIKDTLLLISPRIIEFATLKFDYVIGPCGRGQKHELIASSFHIWFN